VVAINIDGLLAHGTGDFTFKQGDAKTVGYGRTEVAGAEDGVVAVFFFGWDANEEATCVWLRDASEPLALAVVWGFGDQALQH
jgi:hypothetical protein